MSPPSRPGASSPPRITYRGKPCLCRHTCSCKPILRSHGRRSSPNRQSPRIHCAHTPSGRHCISGTPQGEVAGKGGTKLAIPPDTPCLLPGDTLEIKDSPMPAGILSSMPCKPNAPASERKMHALLAYANIWMQHHARNPASCGAQTDPHAAEPKPIRERDWSDMERRRCRRCPQPATPSTLPCLLPGDTPENIALQRVSGSWFSRFPGVHRHRLQWTSPALVIAVLGSIS